MTADRLASGGTYSPQPYVLDYWPASVLVIRSRRVQRRHSGNGVCIAKRLEWHSVERIAPPGPPIPQNCYC